MTQDELLRAIIIEEIGNVAPEVNAASIGDDEDLREALDLDSMDIFNLLAALHRRLGVDIPDRAATQFLTIGGGRTWLAEHTPT